jgi:hypothetical protein
MYTIRKRNRTVLNSVGFDGQPEYEWWHDSNDYYGITKLSDGGEEGEDFYFGVCEVFDKRSPTTFPRSFYRKYPRTLQCWNCKEKYKDGGEDEERWSVCICCVNRKLKVALRTQNDELLRLCSGDRRCGLCVECFDAAVDGVKDEFVSIYQTLLQPKLGEGDWLVYTVKKGYPPADGIHLR